MFLSFNAEIGEPKISTFSGEDHIVVPIIALVEGVLQAANSDQPEFISEKELIKTFAGWNGRPVVVDHPMVKGSFISANSPKILENEQVGLLFNSHVKDGKLKFEAWININSLADKSNRISSTVDKLKKGDIVEVSTGFFTNTRQISGTFKGEAFNSIIEDIIPDHLAILSTATGACSIKDGCGANRMNMKTCEKCEDVCTCEDKTIVLEAEKKEVPEDKGFVQKLLAKIKFSSFKAHNISDDDRRVALDAALLIKDPGFLFIIAVFEDTIVYTTGLGLFRRTFKISDDGSVTLGDEIESVRPETEFVQVIINKENDMTKDKMVSDLIANTATSFNEESREWLTALEENQLSEMIPLEVVVTETETETEAEEVEMKVNETLTALSPEEFISKAPEDIQEVLKQGLRLQAQNRNNMIIQIKANNRNTFTDANFKDFSIETLEKLSALAVTDNYAPQGQTRQLSSMEDINTIPNPPSLYPSN